MQQSGGAGDAAPLVLAVQAFVANGGGRPAGCCIAGADGQSWPCRSEWLLAFRSSHPVGSEPDFRFVRDRTQAVVGIAQVEPEPGNRPARVGPSLPAAQGRAGGAERKMSAPTREQVRTRSGRVLARPPTSGHTNQLSMRFASAPGAAVLAAAATGSSLSHRAPMVSAMLASVPPPASARGATEASSRRPPRAL
jgi:hypothetical protein